MSLTDFWLSLAESLMQRHKSKVGFFLRAKPVTALVSRDV